MPVAKKPASMKAEKPSGAAMKAKPKTMKAMIAMKTKAMKKTGKKPAEKED